MTGAEWVTAAVIGAFIVTYLGLAVGRWPWVRTDRAGIALAGAGVMLAAGGLSVDEASRSVDVPTLATLLGMMLVAADLDRTGVFDRLVVGAGRFAATPHRWLAVVVGLGGGLSAVLVNDVICLALAPVVVRVCAARRFDPRPHLLGLAVAANVGSAATPTGNPQNLIIAGRSGIAFGRFLLMLGPVAAAGLVVCFLVVAVVCRRQLRTPDGAPEPPPADADRSGGWKPVSIAVAAVVALLAGVPVPVVAVAAGALVVLSRADPSTFYDRIDWPTLVMFAGLFVVTKGFELRVIVPSGLADWPGLRDHPVTVLGPVTAVLSNLVSNVPAVLVLAPGVEGNGEAAWLSLAASSTLAGNLTPLGSVATLIVSESARRHKAGFTFAEFCRVGIPVTVLTLLLAWGWLAAVG